MKLSNGHALVLITLAVLPAVSRARADVFNMPSGETSLKFVTVGDPGNAPDTRFTWNGGAFSCGAVSDTFQMGEYDVTAGQYCQFLNAVAATDTYGLYNVGMSGAAPSGPDVGTHIIQNGASGNYTYTVASDWANRPIDWITWGDAVRFCNWLQNGQPTGAEGLTTTETGAYTLDGATTSAALMAVTRNSNARYVIPTEDEWYKAAYYKGGGTNAGYWTYATQSDAVPSNVLSATGTNNVDGVDPTSMSYTIGTPYYFTEVGAFAASPSAYGTFDQGGNVYQWNETVIDGERGMRASAFNYGTNMSQAGDPTTAPYYSNRNFEDPNWEDYRVGFRVASLPPAQNPGDANGDGNVDVNDLTIVLSNFGLIGMSWSQGDFNGDGKVDVNDLTILLSNFGKSYGAGMAAVPEPGTLTALAAGLAGLVTYAWLRATHTLRLIAGTIPASATARHGACAGTPGPGH